MGCNVYIFFHGLLESRSNGTVLSRRSDKTRRAVWARECEHLSEERTDLVLLSETVVTPGFLNKF